MYSSNSGSAALEALARRVEQGDSGAATALRGALQPQFVRMVRHALRYGAGKSQVLRRVMAKAQEIYAAAPDKDAVNEEWLAGQVASSMCASLIEGLRTRRSRTGRLLDTAFAQQELLMTTMA
jgi:hypothetical protein